MRSLAAPLILAFLAQDPAPAPSGPAAEWIWASDAAGDDEECTLARAFEVASVPAAARLVITCDNQFTAHLNEREIGSNGEWERATSYDVTTSLVAGENVLVVECANWSGPAGLLVRLDFRDGAEDDAPWTPALVSDASWRVGTADGEVPAHSFGAHTDPDVTWFDPLVTADATPVDAVTVPDGFTVERVRSAGFGEGSWVSMTFDPEGRVVCGREEGGLVRIDARDRGDVRLESFPDLFRGAAQGLLFAHGGLYTNVNTYDEADGGLWFRRDTDGDGVWDAHERRFAWRGGGEHGCHGIVLGPDGALWMIHGNMVTRPEFAASSPHRNWDEDLLLPRAWDPNGHARGTMAPGSHVLRLEPDGAIELWAAGMRNAYDLAFSPSGELFTYDSDMEWDVGLPWYRPTRIVHLVRAGEYGWRSGSGKWPSHYPDSLPAAVDVGRGSPTGVCFGTDAAFPTRYRDALFAGDWSEGRILAVHLERRGATYGGTFEEFATGRPLNVTDLEIGPDGALWFTTGGRGSQSGLYRIAWTGPVGPPTAVAPGQSPAVDDAFLALGSPDRFVRHAGRVALESQPIASWRDRALEEERVDAALTALVAAARVGAATPGEILDALRRRPFTALLPRQQLDELRVASLALIRGGMPEDESTRARFIARYDPLFPTGDALKDRELFGLLLTLDAPDIVARGLSMATGATGDGRLEERFFYAFALRDHVPTFDAADRERYVAFLLEADEADGGHSLHGYVDGMRLRLPFEDRERSTRAASPPPSLEARETDEPWSRDTLLPELDRVDRGRDHARGKAAYESALCARCHRFAGTGGNGVAPDLTTVSGRLSRIDLLDALLDPSKVVSDQYRDSELVLADGRIVTGRVIAEEGSKIVVRRDPLTGARVTLDRREVVTRRPATSSPMPPALLDRLNLEQILDLLAYLESRGDPGAPAFR